MAFATAPRDDNNYYPSPSDGGTSAACRALSSSSRQQQRRSQPELEFLSNERLVAALVRDAGAGASAKDIQVRLIVQEGEGTTTEIATLADAIQTSVELDQDLIGIALEQEVPVIKIDCLKRIAYQESRKSQKSNRKGQALPEKEFRLKTGIDSADLQRKVDGMRGFLEKGHNCYVTIRSTYRAMKKDIDTTPKMAQRVVELVGDVGELDGKVKVNPNKSFASLSIRPLGGSRKKAT